MVLQRNVSGSSLILPTLDPPAEVLPGGKIDYPTLLAGFVAVTDEQSCTTVAVPDEPDSGKAAPSAATDKGVTRQ